MNLIKYKNIEFGVQKVSELAPYKNSDYLPLLIKTDKYEIYEKDVMCWKFDLDRIWYYEQDQFSNQMSNVYIVSPNNTLVKSETLYSSGIIQTNDSWNEILDRSFIIGNWSEGVDVIIDRIKNYKLFYEKE